MPINATGQGNSRNTPVKQLCLRYFVRVHTAVVARILAKDHPWADDSYCYIDLNAGTGRNDDGSPGSPLIALEEIRAAGLYIRPVAIEQNPHAFDLLVRNLGTRHPYTLFCGDNATILRTERLIPYSHSKKYGLIYADPNKVSEGFPIAEIGDWFQRQPQQLRMLDVLLALSATQIKRVRGAGLDDFHLRDILHTIPKQHWYIREGYLANQWTMLFGTNWDKWPPLRLKMNGAVVNELRDLGMYNIRSAQGQAIADEMMWSTKEREKKSLWLPIDRTPNT